MVGGLDLEAEFLSDLNIERVEIEEGEEVDGFEFSIYGRFSADFGADGEVSGEEFRDFERLGGGVAGVADIVWVRDGLEAILDEVVTLESFEDPDTLSSIL